MSLSGVLLLETKIRIGLIFFFVIPLVTITRFLFPVVVKIYVIIHLYRIIPPRNRCRNDSESYGANVGLDMTVTNKFRASFSLSGSHGTTKGFTIVNLMNMPLRQTEQ